MSYSVRPDGTISADSTDEAVAVSRRLRSAGAGCHIAVEVSRGPRAWSAFAECNIGCAGGDGRSHVQAMERALAGAVRSIYQALDAGTVVLNDVFPITYSEQTPLP